MPKKYLYIGLIAIVVIAAIVALNKQQPKQTDEPQTAAETETTDQNGESFGESVDWKITGIEPGAGIMINTEKAIEAYGLDKAGWQPQESSSAAMLAAIQDAIIDQKPIIATVWEPHAAFSITNIRKLEDPKNIYNDPEQTRAFLETYAPEWKDADVASDVLATVVYKGFAEDAPAAAELFKNFSVPASDQSDWIYEYSVNGTEAEAVAEAYLEEHTDDVAAWMPSEETPLGKDEIIIGIPPWPGATVKSRVIAQLLEDIGYETDIKEMDASIVYTSIADQQIDVNVAGWLPTTHADYWEKFKDDLEIAGINVTQSWLGLGVPDYVDSSIQSLEDLAL